MGLLSIFKKKKKNVSHPSHDASCDRSVDGVDGSDYIHNVSAEVNQAETAPIREDPLISISRQLTKLQYQVSEIKPSVESGVESLREDHYRILEEQVKGSDAYKKLISDKKQVLVKEKRKVEQQIESLDVDERILALLEHQSYRSVEIADNLDISRQYVSNRIKHLVNMEQVERVKRGRNVFYQAKI
jgi:biotin operon repressor